MKCSEGKRHGSDKFHCHQGVEKIVAFVIVNMYFRIG